MKMRKLYLALAFMAAFAMASTAQAGLKAHWDFNEGSGIIANDVTGNGYNGTLACVDWDTGVEGSGVSFDGVGNDSTILISDPTDALSPGDMTGGVGGWAFSIWAKGPLPPSSDNQVIFRKETDAQNFSFLRVGADGSLRFFYEVGDYRTVNPTFSDTSAGAFIPDQWNHIVVSIDATAPVGSQLKYFLNNVDVTGTASIDLATVALSLPGSTLTLGNTANGLGYAGKGEKQIQLDDARFYDHALSLQEVETLYNIPEPATLLLLSLGGVFLRRRR